MPKPLWAPWRLEYVTQADEQRGCPLCAEAAGEVFDDFDVVDCAVAPDDASNDDRSGDAGPAGRGRIARDHAIDFFRLCSARRHR